MRLRSKVGGKALKPRRHKTLTRSDAPDGASPHSIGQEANVARELHEARRQQMATAEILRVIRASPNDVQPVFETIVQNAVSLCGGLFANVFRFDGELLHYVASHNVGPSYADILRMKYPMRPDSTQVSGRVVLTRSVVWLEDARTDPDYDQQFPVAMGWRRLLGVPMLREGEPIGVIGVGWAKAGPASKVQEELLKTFADQAVIAIENVRLFNEAKEALERQTATAEILGAISGSPTDTQPVFDAIVRSGLKLFPGAATTIVLPDGDQMRAVAIADKDSKREKAWRRRFPNALDRTQMHGAAILDCKVIDFPDVKEHVAGPMAPGARNFLASGYRAITIMPMICGKTAIGAISVVRVRPGPLSEKQRELLKTFAAQAVIAIENTRLLSELRQRTNDLSESLEQQTATSEVLKVISSSPGELETVFQTLLENATRICEAAFGSMLQREGDVFKRVALHNAPPAFAQFHNQTPTIQWREVSDLKRVVETKQVIHVADTAAEHPDAPIAKYAGGRTLLLVPMLKDKDLVGVIGIYRQEVRPFTAKQIELVENFAAQAVIAIENARLLNELRESLRQQTATGDVLKVISRSTFDLQTVLDTLVQSAAQLCDAETVNIWQPREDLYRLAASYNEDATTKKFWKAIVIEPGRGSIVGRSLLERKTVHVHDVCADPEFTFGKAQELGRFRTVLAVPMLREGVAIGVFALSRREMRPFTDKQIELVTTFADQAAIAIENVRLFESVEARTQELAKSLEELQTTQDRLVQTQKLALLGQLTAGVAHEIKNPLNFVNNFSGVSAELIDELRETLEGISLDDKARTEINDLTDTLKGNFDKVVHHGRRADAIVKNMLQHSREGSSEHRVIDVNALVEESLNLAWHGARAETQGFEIKLKQSLDPSAGGADVFPQDIRRALLNVISNGFYAATRRRAETNDGDYEPTVTASTKNLGDRVEIGIRDNGTGMTPDVKEKMFNPFFTTKPTGEGTGLGLSISYDIIVKQHAGSIEVDTLPGEFTEITVILPRAAAFV
jgi:GAF domain-containing protein